MNILITAGGTTEKIDAVRGITNYAGGRLGSLVADCFGASDAVERIFYVCSRAAQRPATQKAQCILAEDTRELEAAVRQLLAQNRVDAVIHSMAVSDYRVKTVTTLPHLLSGKELDRTQKIPSGRTDLLLQLEPTPKIIALFRTLAPGALLVGFKLLSGAGEAELIDTAYRLLQENGCTFVLANDLREFHGDAHAAYLIDGAKQLTHFNTKQQIARGIAAAVLEKSEREAVL
ncbi:MAG: phosphopantothenate--cysteine ligase [Oscillospiraceae bacterium]|jgi:phosphopantothenate-cysteine ligase|nr:phosphopantothenate--cysteine ligase [Oscillospiraceae bacterium]